MDLDRHLAERLAAAVPAGAGICVGLSGGLDSMVLLDALSQLAKKGSDSFFAGRKRNLTPFSVAAVHVHHGLSPNADGWAAFCERECAMRGVACTVERVRVERGAGVGLEAAARAARYAVYAGRREPIVALAHHLDDQAETVLLQLLRGTGLKGLAAMPELRTLERREKGVRFLFHPAEKESDPFSAVRTLLFRPFLDVPRAAIRAHALARGLRWIEDESNASREADRNYLRHEVAPRLDARFPGWREAAARCAGHASRAASLLTELGRIDGAPQRPGEGLVLDDSLDDPRRANALRAYLAIEGLAMPSEARIAEMARQLYGAKADARVRVAHEGATLVRHRGVARIVREPESAPASTIDWRIEWRGETRVDLGAGRGSVLFAPATGLGLDADLCRSAAWHFAPRRGGERMRIAANGRSRTVKNLLREAGIPEWQRASLPLLFHGESLAWVPGIGVAAEFACPEDRAGMVPAWSREARPALSD